MLTGWLEHHRGILIWKCEDLTAEQLRRRAVPPSTLSLLRLVRHMAEVERADAAMRAGRAGIVTPCVSPRR